jgi:hypothetical protein
MDQARIEACTQLLLEACGRLGMAVSADQRIGEADVAELLGWSHQGLKNARHEGTGPPAYRVALGMARVTYRISDLAHWLESRRAD